MRYATATIGAIFIFLAVFALCLVLIAFLPPAFRPVINLPLGQGFVWINNPLAFVGLLLAILSARHSFRSTLRRYAAKAASSGDSFGNQVKP